MQYLTTTLFLSTLATIVGSQTIDPSTVPDSTRTLWCQNQIAACPLLCTQQSNSATTRSNTCDAKSLAWTCVCVDGTIPAVANYSQTVPFYECQEFGNQCVTACGSDNSCASACRTNYPCGAQNPVRVNVTSTTSSRTSTATGSSATGSDGTFGGAGTSNSNSGSGSSSSNNNAATTSSTTTTNAAMAMDIGRSYGVAILASAIFAGFAIAL